jgi:2'-5' RNA ligase
MLPNWFIALPLRAAAPLPLPAAPMAVRVFAPEDLHLTIAFLGSCSLERARAAFELTQAFPLRALQVRLANVVALGPAHKPSAFSALLADGRVEVEQAMAASRAQLWAAADARTDTRPPLAHVTLARPRRRATQEQVSAATAWATALDLGLPSCRLERIALYTWSAGDRSRSLFQIDRERPLAP